MFTMRELPLDTRPRERLLVEGRDALSLPELFAIVLGSGTKGKSVLALSEELLVRFGSLTALLDASLEELMEIKGIGKAKALQLQAVFGIIKKAKEIQAPLKQKVDGPQMAFELVQEKVRVCKEEALFVLLRDVKGRLQHVEKIGVGTLSKLLIHPREVFYPAVRHKADSLILAHNHPSGDLTPSSQDLAVTKALLLASEAMGIRFIDHLIVSPYAYLSLREQGYIGKASPYD